MQEPLPPILLDASRLGSEIETSGGAADPRFRNAGVLMRIDHSLLARVSDPNHDDFGNWPLALNVKKVFFEPADAATEADRLNRERETQNDQRGFSPFCSYWATTAKIDRRELESIAARQRQESADA